MRVCSIGPGMVFHGLSRHVFIPPDRGFLLCLGPIPPSIRYTVGFINLTGLQAFDLPISLCMKETYFFLDPVVVADPDGAKFFFSGSGLRIRMYVANTCVPLAII
jgi:hypothetical protein